MSDEIPTIGDLDIKPIKMGIELFDEYYSVFLIGSIGDQSCFYHSLCKATSKEYQEYEDNIYARRQSFTDNFRKAIACWLLTETINEKTGVVFTEKDAILKINMSDARLNRLFNDEVRDPNNFFFEQFNEKISWFYNIYINLVDRTSVERELYLKWIIENTRNGMRSYTHDGQSIYFFTIESLLEELNKMDITENHSMKIKNKLRCDLSDLVGEERVELFYQPYMKLIDTCIGENKTANQILEELNLKDNPYSSAVKEYIESRMKMGYKLKKLLGDPRNAKRSKYDSRRIKTYVEQVVRCNTPDDTLIRILSISANRSTGKYWTLNEAMTYLHGDPRKNFTYPININYYLLGDGVNIERYDLPNDEGKYSFRIEELINRILPHFDGKRVIRMDAGEDDIIPIMPYIINANIYLVDVTKKGMRVTRKYISSSKNPYIILRHNGSHFELISVAEGKCLKTLFCEKDAIILALNH